VVDSSSENVVLSPNVLGPWAESIGLEFTHVAPDEVQATWRVTAALTQPYGLLHGGVHCSVVETLSSLGASIWLGERGQVVGVSNSTSFFRPCVVGDLLSSIARPIEQSPERQVWQVNTSSERRGLVAQGTVRLHHLLN
jgi:1,4-dihydroxy-2-naphthoyl-CoA hydrolase